MTEKCCIGCGIKLQNEDLNLEGYTPKEIKKNEDMYCQRCFQLKNYGKYTLNKLTREDYRKEVNQLLDKIDLVLPVFDIIDFEGSFDDDILDILREKDSIIIINKLDLVPTDKHPSEVANWVKNRLAEEGIAPLDIAIVSTKNNYGINGIYKKIKYFYPNGVNGMVIGVTNVGKSSIINRLVGKKIATVSKYPGTTLKNILNMIPYTNIGLYDTPGLIPKGRISDFLCDACAQKTVPATEISRKTFKTKKDRVIMLGNLLQFKILNEEDIKPIFTLFSSREVPFHETNIEKARELSENNFFNIPCEKCREKFNGQKKSKKIIKINQGEELVFKGLGWLSVKRGPLLIELTMPEGTELINRKAFIDPRR
ncbi:MAG: ribosome biogenesis GTPase YqeH [Fusobacterium sp.]|uniref:ribosome biogenesis GTPase YqeH n=1 Tax=Fusobacterium sp. TaxID=68766 RepID=UPI0026DCA9A1|nr:ribosome biogenesis GTPase YqeH [Fusobacterium sp.]MDO4690207.1 ribosome biogenesis GTPase YqeH [Fusobacterium sp.]